MKTRDENRRMKTRRDVRRKPKSHVFEREDAESRPCRKGLRSASLELQVWKFDHDVETTNDFGGSMKTRRWARYFWTGRNPQFRALLVLILCAGLNAYAQQITGTIAGTVKDPQGAVVISATVKATNVDTGLSRSTTTADGAYLIQYLPIGTYIVEVDAA